MIGRAAVRRDLGRPGAGAEAPQLVLHRVRPHRGRTATRSIFGAGILSSTGEIPFSLSTAVERRPFVTDEVIETDYDPSRMQELLFVIPSFAFLRREVADLVARMGIDVS